ncbi:Uncharacterised protein [[Pasteurella] aerogenes]|nr:Uncharacterised protein [[Pasteurella] aerogenes]
MLQVQIDMLLLNDINIFTKTEKQNDKHPQPQNLNP